MYLLCNIEYVSLWYRQLNVLSSKATLWLDIFNMRVNTSCTFTVNKGTAFVSLLLDEPQDHCRSLQHTINTIIPTKRVECQDLFNGVLMDMYSFFSKHYIFFYFT